MEKIKAPRGASDVLPPTSELLTEVETLARSLCDRHGYRRIEPPVFEQSELFVKASGEASDIVVQKQMYTFTDRSGRSLTLRPEGTPSTVRAFIEHKLDGKLPLPVRLYYWGPMFRYERPQQGRTRQFVQFGLECIGSAGPLVDAEVILATAEFFASLQLEPQLLLNSLGCRDDQQRYAVDLRTMLSGREDDLCGECLERLKVNPLRIFDCKVPACQDIVRSDDVVPIVERLCDACSAHFERLQEILESLGIAWRNAPDLVRGLDYYTRTIFEFDLPTLGARSTVAGGGRYDDLVRDMGGPDLPALGVGIGIEPTLVALAGREDDAAWRPDVFVAFLAEDLAAIAMALARDIRATGKRVVTADDASRSLKSQLNTANRLGASHAVLIMPEEAARGTAILRDLEAKTQEELPLKEVVARC